MVWCLHSKTSLYIVVWFSLIYGKLPPSVFQIVHFHMLIKSCFIYPALPFHLAVMPWRGYLYPVADDSHLRQCPLKQRQMSAFDYNQTVGELCSVVRLYLTYWKRGMPYQFLQKVFRTVCAVFLIQFPVCPPAAFIHRCIRIVFFSVRHTIGWHIFHIHLYFLARVICSFIRFGLPFLFLFCRFQFPKPWCNPLKTAITSYIAVLFNKFLVPVLNLSIYTSSAGGVSFAAHLPYDSGDWSLACGSGLPGLQTSRHTLQSIYTRFSGSPCTGWLFRLRSVSVHTLQYVDGGI